MSQQYTYKEMVDLLVSLNEKSNTDNTLYLIVDKTSYKDEESSANYQYEFGLTKATEEKAPQLVSYRGVDDTETLEHHVSFWRDDYQGSFNLTEEAFEKLQEFGLDEEEVEQDITVEDLMTGDKIVIEEEVVVEGGIAYLKKTGRDSFSFDPTNTALNILSVQAGDDRKAALAQAAKGSKLEELKLKAIELDLNSEDVAKVSEMM